MEKSMLVTGSKGVLGARIAAFYEKKYHVIRTSRESLDVTDEEAVSRFIKDKKPDVVIHCAAVSNTQICEEIPSRSKAVNVKGTENLAGACAENGSRFVYMSSDQIYGGSMLKRANKETDAVLPMNAYGIHKKQAEEEILRILPDGICLRLSWLYDFPVKGMKSNHNLLEDLLTAMNENRPLKLPVYDFRGMTWVQEVVRNIEKAIELPGGIYNFGSESTLSTYEIGRRFLQLLDKNISGEKILTADQLSFADSPRNLTMNIEKIRARGIDFPDTISGFEKCLENSPSYGNALLV